MFSRKENRNFNSFLFTFAAGEVVIRQALGELDVWEIDAKFSFVEHQARFVEILNFARHK